MTEAAFFAAGVLPYWLTLYRPYKDEAYWRVLVWCCFVFLAYFYYHGAWAAVANNAVELGIAAYGLKRSKKVWIG